MTHVDRRRFLQLAAAAAVPLPFERALSIPAHDRHGSIEDVEHVIFLMQENRSFDHYLGTMRGVRGFADPHPARHPDGRSVFHQADGAATVLPFRPQVPDLGRTFLPDPPHGWNDTHGAWNHGRYDGWVPNKGVTTMTHHTRQDLPYQYALADAFTVCDNYHCSLLGPTDPNRYHMWTGWVGNDGRGGGPVITNAEAGYDWTTYPERLERAGVSWKVYQDVGLGLTAEGSWGWTPDPFIGNYGDNALLYFHQYQRAAPGSPLAKAKTGTEVAKAGRRPEELLADFRADVAGGRLPQVSWIVAPEAYTEHPNWEPDYGTWYVSQVIDILAAHPAVWSKMALFITYDEEGGFFDHLVPPTPPATRAEGLSTVPVTNEIYPGSAEHPAGPYGLGVRVPMIIVSPWTRGGWVNSELFDHTSLIRFLERRFGTAEPNITPWRRAVTGDLTSAFDFRTPNRGHRVDLPGTAGLKPADLTRQPDQVPVPPAEGRLPAQERGVRPARALPYALHADGRPSAGALAVDFRNTGAATGVYQVRSADPAIAPRTYTVEPGKQVTDVWPAEGGYDLAIHGPNGFFRRVAAGPRHPGVTVRGRYEGAGIVLEVANHGAGRADVDVADHYSGHHTRLALRAGETRSVPVRGEHGWYGLSLTIPGDAAFAVQYAGHAETGEPSISDPLMGGLIRG